MMRFFTLISLCLISLQLQAADASVDLDRSWGLLIGDKFTATVTLPVEVSELDTHSLPQKDKRYGPWLFLNDTELNGQSLLLHFQLINVPAENRQVPTPEIEIRTLSGGFISVPSVPMQIGSFLEQGANGETTVELIPRGDFRLLPKDHQALSWRLRLSLAVFIISGLIWLIWHFGLRPRHRLPFANAMFELNKMRLLGRKDSDAASRSLHHAFNRSAGRVVINSELASLWHQCPWLESLKSEIEGFYQTSATHYFSPNSGAQTTFDDIIKLARACREQERLA